MKKELISLKEVFDSLDIECLKKQLSFNSNFEIEFMSQFKKFSEMKISLSQRRRLIRLVNFLSLGFRKIRFDFETVLKFVENFLRATENKNALIVRNVFEGLTVLPKKSMESKEIKGINSDWTERDAWGQKSYLEEFGLFNPENLNLIKRIRKIQKGK